MTARNPPEDGDPVPGHVPAMLVHDFDMFRDPAYRADPHGRVMELLRTAPPVFWSPRNGGHWILLSHAANFDAARDLESFSSEMIPHDQLQELLAGLPEEVGRVPLPYPILLDPPLHAIYRQPLQQVFSPKTVRALGGRVRALARELLARVADAGQCEFMAAVAEPLPVHIFLEMLGLPLEKLGEYRVLLKRYMRSIQGAADSGESMLALQGVVAAMSDELAARREDPRDDIISLLWQTAIDGRPITLEEMENYCALLFIAGLDTVMQAIGYAVRHLALHPDLQERLRTEPSRLDDAIEEILRRYSFALPARRVTRDLEFHGVRMQANDQVRLFLHAANLDPGQFPAPEQVDLDRANKTHLAFNAGPHRCLGSHLARLELRILYEEVLAAIPPFRLDPQHPAAFDCGNVVGIEHLHLLWEA